MIQDGELEHVGGTTTLKVDVRLVAATNRRLDEGVKAGRFRPDLWYRLNVFPITVPPLRQRREDVPMLVQHFVGKHCRRLGRPGRPGAHLAPTPDPRKHDAYYRDRSGTTPAARAGVRARSVDLAHPAGPDSRR